MVKEEPTQWLVCLPLLHCVGFGEAQNEEKKHEIVFYVQCDPIGEHWGSLLRRVGVPVTEKT